MSVQLNTALLHVTREVVDLDWLPRQGECVHEGVVQVSVLLLSVSKYAMCKAIFIIDCLLIKFIDCIRVCLLLVVVAVLSLLKY